MNDYSKSINVEALRAAAQKFIRDLDDDALYQMACYGGLVFTTNPEDAADFDYVIGSSIDNSMQENTRRHDGVVIAKADPEQEGGSYDENGKYIPSLNAVSDTREWLLQEAESLEVDWGAAVR